jgi:hypothetical protein
MLQRQREMFCRALNADQATPTPPPSEPAMPADDNSSAIRAMPPHELFIGYFVASAADGATFFEALDAWASGKNLMPKSRLDVLERVLVDRMREVLRSRGGVKSDVAPQPIDLWSAMLFLAQLGEDMAQDTLAQALRGWPDHGDTPLAECLFQGRRYVALLYAAFAVHPDHISSGDPSQIVLGWKEAGSEATESKQLVDWFCANHPMQALRVERDLKIKMRKQGWHV